ncbi:hypothetical protein [Pragia fontium]|uniref:hypothetical protein n=1 Tax=Pragia fontium TaxID=82985 RepID=UPI000F70777A|nr:hypothetical protein [Pragia fontium]VEJ56210.1 Uncharacterised protein [Pragia fontium]
MSVRKILILLPIFIFIISSGNLFSKENELGDVYSEILREPMHIKYQGQESVLLFFKNSLKDKKEEYSISSHIPLGEIYNLTNKGMDVFYVSKIEGDELVDVFIYDDVNYSKNKSVYIITRSKSNIESISGYYYNSIEYPLFIEQGMLKIEFFSGSYKPDTIFNNCFDGIRNGKKNICQYKDKDAIKKYLDNRLRGL